MAGAAASELDARWPRWPDGEEGRVTLDVVLDLPVDQAFLLLYGGLNDLRKTFNELAGDREYSTTGWVEGAEAVQAAAVGPTPPPLASAAGLRAGFLRRASYSGTMMGSKYRNEELYRLVEATPGSSYTVMATILTTAMHGEKFRPVVMCTLRSLPDGRTEFRIRTTILFIVKPNGFIKAMIDKGARDGQRKNFEALRKVLSQFTTVTEAAAAAEGLPAPAAAAAEAAPAAAAATAAPAAPAAGVMETVLGSEACRHLEPWANALHAQLAALSPAAGDLVDARVLLGALGALGLLSVLRLVIDMLLFVQHASAAPQDTIGMLTRLLFKMVDVPETMHEVLLSCLIFYTVRLLVNRLAAVIPAPPRSATARAAAAAASPAAARPSAGSPPAAELAAGLAASKGARTEEQEAEGVKYEGYAEAIAAAQAQPISPQASTAASEAAAATDGAGAAVLAANQPSFMKSFTKSISDAFGPSRGRKASGTALSGLGPASGAGSPPSATSPPNGAASPGRVAEEAGAAATAAGAAKSTPSSPSAAVLAPLGTALAAGAAAVGASAAGAAPAAEAASARPSLQQQAVSRSLSDSEALQAHAAALRDGQAGLQPSLSAEASGLVAGEVLGSEQGSGPLAAGLLGTAGVQHAKSTGALVEPSGASSASVTSLAKKLRGVLSPTGQPSSPRERTTSADGGSSAAASPERALSPTAAQRDFRPAMPAHLAPGLAAEAVIEEIFENQRLQPFRGWGHSWPGHFLPTDKVNHWSRREHDNFPLLTGADFSAIAPPLPEGWQWCEEKWHLDRSAQIIDACDADGWSYGLDFGFVRHPFQPNSGKKKVTDFVRRRRWIRTRVPLALAAQPRLTAIAQDSSSWSETAEVSLGNSADAEAPGAPAQEAAEGQASAAGSGSVTAGSEVAAASAASEASAAGTASAGAGGQPQLGRGSPGGALGAPAPAAAAATAAAGAPWELGQEPSLSPDQSEVHAVLESFFARVEAKSVQASMQEALAQKIGTTSRSGSGAALPNLSPQSQAQQQGSATPVLGSSPGSSSGGADLAAAAAGLGDSGSGREAAAAAEEAAEEAAAPAAEAAAPAAPQQQQEEEGEEEQAGGVSEKVGDSEADQPGPLEGAAAGTAAGGEEAAPAPGSPVKVLPQEFERSHTGPEELEQDAPPAAPAAGISSAASGGQGGASRASAAAAEAAPAEAAAAPLLPGLAVAEAAEGAGEAEEEPEAAAAGPPLPAETEVPDAAGGAAEQAAEGAAAAAAGTASQEGEAAQEQGTSGRSSSDTLHLVAHR